MPERDDERPDPDALLAQVAAQEAEAQRARLRIFFGAAPGVGKTYAMLEAAGIAARDGLKVVVGVAETHGRSETAALLADLEILPRRAVDYRGVRLEELDLEAALARKPAVLLVDELAHTNAPGSRHAKRWQDVLDLLHAGIEVWTTLNVQHVESLGDVVQQITGVKVRETVPDAVLERADEIVLVDLPPDQLLERLAEGKVYIAGQAVRAAKHFFQRGNLLALRELALRRTAERVDADVLRYRREHGIEAPWPTRERIAVCVGPSPASERLIRATKRMAESLHAEWTAAHVEVIGAAPLGERDSERLEAHMRLAESLGGEVVRVRSNNVAEALLEYARAHNVTQIVAGKPTHSRWRDRIRGSLLDSLIRGSGAIEIHVIAPIEAEKAPPAAPGPRTHLPPAAYAWALAPIAIVTAIGIIAYRLLALEDITVMYMLAIMIASLLGRGPSLLAATSAVAAFDVFFVPPRWTFTVSDTRYVLTFTVMFAAGAVISTLVTRLRRQEHEAIGREHRTAALLAFTRDVANAATVEDVAAEVARHLEDTLDVAATVLVPDAAEGLVSVAGLLPLAEKEITVARWSFDHRAVAGHGTDTLAAARVLCVPMVVGEACVGALAIQRRRGTPLRLDVDQRHLIDALARQAASAIARVQLGEEAKQAALRARTEELRSSLLSSVSHDLRTPLAVITGSATTLRDMGVQLSPKQQAELLSSIITDAQRLERVLQNLLQLTRVETGLTPTREWMPAEEVIGAALTRLEDSLRDQPVELEVPSDVLVRVDPLLFEQALLNLIENALKHAAPPFRLAAKRVDGAVHIEVADRGPGLPPGDSSRLFEKFVRASAAPGAGIGLAVVRAIVEAHGGRVDALSREGGGALFRIVLPTPAPPASLVGSQEHPAA